MNRLSILLAIILCSGLLMNSGSVEGIGPGSPQKKKYPMVTIQDTEARKLLSRMVKDEFRIHVYLPRGYYSGIKNYPVIYLLDAEYSFGCVAYVVRRLIKGREIPEAVVVGVSYEVPYEEYYRRRQRDFAPTKYALDEFPMSGFAENFAKFLQYELIPFVNKNYRTKQSDTTIIGFSLSGLFNTYMLFQHTHLFNRYVIISPSLWWDHNICFRYERQYAKNKSDLPARMYMVAGEQDGPLIKNTVAKMKEILAKRNYDNFVYQVSFLPDETHRTIYANAVTKGLRFVFTDFKK